MNVVNIDTPHNKNLTFKQKNFVKEFVANNGNATQAALKAYPNMSYNGAMVIASDMLRLTKIQQAIHDACSESGMTIKDVGSRLAKWMKSESHDASLRAISLWGDFVGAKVTKVEHNHNVNVNINIRKMLDNFGEDT